MEGIKLQEICRRWRVSAADVKTINDVELVLITRRRLQKYVGMWPCVGLGDNTPGDLLQMFIYDWRRYYQLSSILACVINARRSQDV